MFKICLNLIMIPPMDYSGSGAPPPRPFPWQCTSSTLARTEGKNKSMSAAGYVWTINVNIVTRIWDLSISFWNSSSDIYQNWRSINLCQTKLCFYSVPDLQTASQLEFQTILREDWSFTITEGTFNTLYKDTMQCKS